MLWRKESSSDGLIHTVEIAWFHLADTRQIIYEKMEILVLEGHRSAWHERVQTLVVGGVSIRNRSVISN